MRETRASMGIVRGIVRCIVEPRARNLDSLPTGSVPREDRCLAYYCRWVIAGIMAETLHPHTARHHGTWNCQLAGHYPPKTGSTETGPQQRPRLRPRLRPRSKLSVLLIMHVVVLYSSFPRKCNVGSCSTHDDDDDARRKAVVVPDGLFYQACG